MERGAARETLEARFDVLDPTQVETLGIRAGIREFFEVNAVCLVPGVVMGSANLVYSMFIDYSVDLPIRVKTGRRHRSFFALFGLSAADRI